MTGLQLMRHLTWWLVLGCLVLVGVLLVLDAAALPPRLSGVAVAVAVASCAGAGALFLRAGLLRPLAPGLALLAAVDVVIGRAADAGGFPWMLPLAAVTAAAWAARPGPVVPGIGAAVAFAAALGGSRGSWPAAATDAAITVLAAGGIYVQVWILHVAERLDRSRRLEGAAAVAEERLRFAADLHDIQGHSLQVIALKSELAERLVPVDPARAATEMREVQELARRALGETREVVHGYRAVTLETEIANAARVLRAAGIEVTVTAELPPLPAAVRAVFGLVVRECATNVLRHSAARRCDIAVAASGGTARLCFGNDAPLGTTPGPAGGLAGLGDRLTAAGGDLRFRGTPDAFTVEATVPVAS